MKTTLSGLALGLTLALASWAHAIDRSQVVVTADDIAIQDKALEKKLIELVKKEGTLTSTRQVDSYEIAVLCEYPPKINRTEPYCFFRKVKVTPK